MIPIDLLKKLDSHTKPEPTVLVEEVQLETNKEVRFGITLGSEVRDTLLKLLKHRMTIFS